MPTYTNDELDGLEMAAEVATPNQQLEALAFMTGTFKSNHIAYAVMGGMNFYLRGSGRLTTDVDIAVDNPPPMAEILDVFSDYPGVHLPHRRMQWLAGVARIFVDTDGQLVQFDLKHKGAEGYRIPGNLADAVERLTVNTPSVSFQCDVLAIGPLVTAKIKAHSNREVHKDYIDLRFVCKSAEYASLVRGASRNFREEWKRTFLEALLVNNPEDEEQIRWALDMARTPSPVNQPAGRGVSGHGAEATADSGRRYQCSGERCSGSTR